MTSANESVAVLDHGYVKYVEHWGSDERVVEAARMSTGKGFLGWDPGPCPACTGDRLQVTGHSSEGSGSILAQSASREPQAVCSACEGSGKVRGDLKLLAYLWEHRHATPFEMAGVVLEVQAPIFVFREWHRHRTQSYNEMSSRYVPLPDLNYVPSVERLLSNSKTNKQAGLAKGAADLTPEKAEEYRVILRATYLTLEAIYQGALVSGVPKELARIHLPVGRYSRMRVSANLRNWLAFLTLRMDPAAQWEIRQYAEAVGETLSRLYPRTWELFSKGIKST